MNLRIVVFIFFCFFSFKAFAIQICENGQGPVGLFPKADFIYSGNVDGDMQNSTDILIRVTYGGALWPTTKDFLLVGNGQGGYTLPQTQPVNYAGILGLYAPGVPTIEPVSYPHVVNLASLEQECWPQRLYSYEDDQAWYAVGPNGFQAIPIIVENNLVLVELKHDGEAIQEGWGLSFGITQTELGQYGFDSLDNVTVELILSNQTTDTSSRHLFFLLEAEDGKQVVLDYDPTSNQFSKNHDFVPSPQNSYGGSVPQYSIADTGSVSIVYPIAVGEGSAGVSPQLALSYSSASGRGLAGEGWALSGQSSVARCRKTLSLDGELAPIRLGVGDGYCLDGQRLILVSGVDGADNSEYVPEIIGSGSYIKVIAKGGVQGNPDYWLVHRKDGSISEYGKDRSSKVRGSVNSGWLTWNISQISDNVGNQIQFGYAGNPDAGEVYLQAIKYAGEIGAASWNSGFRNKVWLTYESVPSKIAYINGEKFYQSKRLKSVTAYINDTEFRKYNLFYDVSDYFLSNDPQPELLKYIQECVGSNCFKANEFLYTTDTVTENSYDQYQSIYLSDRGIPGSYGDFNGDGRTDYHWLRHDGSPTEETDSRYLLAGGLPGVSGVRSRRSETWSTQFLDLNYDGYDDKVFVGDSGELIVRLARVDQAGAFIGFANDGMQEYIETGLHLGIAPKTGSEDEEEFGVKFLDLNGDGFTDILYNSRGMWDGQTPTDPKLQRYFQYKYRLGEKSVEQLGSTDGINPAVYGFGPEKVLEIQYKNYPSITPALLYPVGPSPSRISGELDLLVNNYNGVDFNGDGLTDLAGMRMKMRWNYHDPCAVEDSQTPVVCVGDGKDSKETSEEMWMMFVTQVDSAGDISLVEYSTLLTQTAGKLSPESVLHADFNADGLTDYMFKKNGSAWSVYLNTGLEDATSGEAFILKSSVSFDHQGAPQLSDFNGDGFVDLYYEHNGLVSVRLWNAHENGFGQAMEVHQGHPSAQGFTLVDWDGDGFSDITYYTGDGDTAAERFNFSLRKHTDSQGQSKPFSKLTSMYDALGSKVSFSYDVTTNQSFYEPYKNADDDSWDSLLTLAGTTAADENVVSKEVECVVRDIRTPMYFVSAMEHSAPNSVLAGDTLSHDLFATLTTRYKYEGLKMQACGRGSLGFLKMTSSIEESGLTTIKTFRQDYPYVGSTVKVENRSTTDTSLLDNLLTESLTRYKLVDYHYGDIATGSKTAPYMPAVHISEVTQYENDFGQAPYASAAPAMTTTTAYQIQRTTFDEYDEWGNVKKQTNETVNPRDDSILKSLITVNQYHSDIGFRQLGRITRSDVTATSLSGAPQTRAAEFTYYISGAIRGMLREEITDPDGTNGLTKQYLYDGYGNISKIKTYKVEGQSERYVRYTYSHEGRFVEKTFNNFENLGYWSEVSEVQRNHPLLLPTTSISNGRITKTMTYDPFGRVLDVNLSTGESTSISYEACSGCFNFDGSYQIRTVDNNFSSQSVVKFDILGRESQTTSTAFDGATLYQDTFYDQFGRKLLESSTYKATDTDTYWMAYTYDVLNRIHQVIPKTSDSLANTFTTDSSVATEEYSRGTFDYFTIPVSFIAKDVNGQLFAESYVLEGMLSNTYEYPYADQNGDNLLRPAQTVSFVYDSFGNVTQTSTQPQMGGPISINIEYDNMNRKTKLMDPDAGTTFYEYTDFGELDIQTHVIHERLYSGSDPAALSATQKQVVDLDYDGLGRLTNRTVTNAGVLESSTTWVFDTYSGAGTAQGLLKHKSHSSGYAETFQHDSFGRGTQVDYTVPGLNATLTASTTYNSITGRAEEATSVSAVKRKNVYNTYGYLKKVNFEDGTNNWLSAIDIENQDSQGRITEQTNFHGIDLEQVYTRQGLVRQIVTDTLYPNDPAPLDIEYVRDEWSNVISKYHHHIDDDPQVSGAGLWEHYCYDDFNRLVYWKDFNHTDSPSVRDCTGVSTSSEALQLDDLGNVMFKPGVGDYTYGTGTNSIADAGPHAVLSTNTGTTPATEITYSYDYRGNMVSSSNGRSVQYNVFNKPTQVTFTSPAETQTIQYTYGPDKQRWRRYESDTYGAAYTYYVGGDEIVHHVNSGKVEYKTSVAGVVQVVKEANQTDTVVPDYTQITAKRLMYFDSQGSLAFAYDVVTSNAGYLFYDPWGKRRSVATSYQEFSPMDPSNLFYKLFVGHDYRWGLRGVGYTGHEQIDSNEDIDVGLVHMNGRIYDPHLGRFMSPDPIVQNPKDVQTYNRYAYVRNNPMTNIDPSGYSYIGDNKHRIGEGAVYVGTAMSFAPPPYNFIGIGIAAGGQAMMGDTRGAAITVFVSFASIQIGQAGQGANAISKGRQAFWHGMVGGVAAELQGGKFQHGFLSSWATKHVMSSDALTSGGTDFSDRLGRVSLAAIVGGTISEVTGGKFANGARTAAMQQLFNQETQMKPKGKFIVHQGEAPEGVDMQTDFDVARARAEKAGLTIFEELEASGQDVHVVYTSGESQTRNNVIYWNPRMGNQVKNGLQSAATVLAHEVGHPYQQYVQKVKPTRVVRFGEDFSYLPETPVIRNYETPVASFYGEGTRRGHSDYNPFSASCVTCLR